MKIDKKMPSISVEKRFVYRVLLSDNFARVSYHSCKTYNTLFNDNKVLAVLSLWAKEYFENYHIAPKEALWSLYEHQKKNISEFLLSEIEIFLENLDNIDPLILKFYNHSESEVIENLKYLVGKKLSSDIAEDPAKFQQLSDKYSNLLRMKKEEFSLFYNQTSAEMISEAFEERLVPLFTFPGVLGNYIDSLCRGDFFAVLGGTGVGKSFFKQQIAMWGVLSGLKVVFFSMEMTQNSMIRRVYQYLIANPCRTYEFDYWFPRVGTYDVSSDDQTPKYRIDLEKRRNAPQIPDNIDTIKNRLNKMQNNFPIGNLKLRTHAQWELSAADVDCELNQLESEGFKADLIVLDYMDIMRRPGRTYDLDSENFLWAEVKRLAINHNCVVISSTQSNRDCVRGKGEINKSSTGGAFKKVSHLDTYVSITQSPTDRKIGIVRLKTEKSRDGYASPEEIAILTCPSIGRFYCDALEYSKIYGAFKDNKIIWYPETDTKGKV